jgi:hypothetical protein
MILNCVSLMANCKFHNNILGDSQKHHISSNVTTFWTITVMLVSPLHCHTILHQHPWCNTPANETYLRISTEVSLATTHRNSNFLAPTQFQLQCPSFLGDTVHRVTSKRESNAVTSLEWPRGFQEVKVSRFLDNGTGWW